MCNPADVESGAGVRLTSMGGAASRLGLSRAQVGKMVKRGVLPSVRHGGARGTIYIPSTAIDAYIGRLLREAGEAGGPGSVRVVEVGSAEERRYR